tara:strand:+ start:3112 stop:4098 length:987 start_codon:yes stop_codon:yes gene_type:complete
MKKNTSNIETALIGCGYWGTNIARSLLKITSKKILVFDKYQKNSIILKKRFSKNLVIANSLNIILNNKNVKNVILATPPNINFLLLKKLIKHKKNIFIEKPGLRTLGEINKIKKMKNKKILMFGYIYTFNNNIKFIKKFIKNKNNGKLLYLNFLRQNLGPIRNDINVSYDLSSHDLSILYYLFDKLPKKINNNSYAILKKNISDISNLSFKLNNFFVDINNSWLSPDKVRRITIISEKKMLLFNEMNLEHKIKIFNKYATYPKISEFNNKFFDKKAKIYEGTSFTPKIKQNDSLKDELIYFFNCIKRNKKPLTDINFATQIIKCLKGV